MKRLLKWLGIALGVVVILFAGLFGWLFWTVSNPDRMEPLVLPAALIDVGSEEGKSLLRDAVTSDHASLSQSFQVQEKGSWCGVASAVAVLNARGAKLSQDDFFSEEATEVRPWFKTTFGGMTLQDLAGMMRAHGADAAVHHASSSSVDEFRADLASNLDNAGDWLIVNYDRKILSEVGSGHISPVSAYSKEKDMVLLLDTAGYKYPHHWVPVAELFRAMNTPDSESKKSRGWVVVR
jgi:hypothetical protein